MLSCKKLLLRGVIASHCLALCPAAAGDNTGQVSPDESEITVIGTSPKRPAVPATFGSSDIKDWYAPDNSTLIISTYAHGKFKATLSASCIGIRSTETLGFSNQGPFQLDRSTMIVLPGGERCFFKDLAAYSEDEEQRDKEARKQKK